MLKCQQTYISKSKVSAYKNTKLIMEKDDSIEVYVDVDAIREVREQAEYGLYYPVNEEALEACDQILSTAYC
jgi:RNA binding exosome subunit